MSLTKSPTRFVVYYNITYKVCILILYHLFCYFSAFFSLPCHRSTDYLVLHAVHDTTMINVHDMAINNFHLHFSRNLVIFYCHYWLMCMFPCAQRWSSFSFSVVCGIIASVRETSLCLLQFYGNSGARDNSTRRSTASSTVPCIAYANKSLRTLVLALSHLSHHSPHRTTVHRRLLLSLTTPLASLTTTDHVCRSRSCL